MSLVTLAVAWVLANPVITAPIIGASRPEQLDDSLAAAVFRIDARPEAADGRAHTSSTGWVTRRGKFPDRGRPAVRADGVVEQDDAVPADYEKIRDENIARYGWDTAVLDLLGHLYSERTHFIFELIQNAEDAGASELVFELFDDRLELRHNGRPV